MPKLANVIPPAVSVLTSPARAHVLRETFGRHVFFNLHAAVLSNLVLLSPPSQITPPLIIRCPFFLVLDLILSPPPCFVFLLSALKPVIAFPSLVRHAKIDDHFSSLPLFPSQSCPSLFFCFFKVIFGSLLLLLALYHP